MKFFNIFTIPIIIYMVNVFSYFSNHERFGLLESKPVVIVVLYNRRTYYCPRFFMMLSWNSTFFSLLYTGYYKKVGLVIDFQILQVILNKKSKIIFLFRLILAGFYRIDTILYLKKRHFKKLLRFLLHVVYFLLV